MTSLSTQQKMKMSLDEIQDFEHIEKICAEDNELPTLYDLADTTKLSTEMGELQDDNDKLKRTITNVLKKNDDLELTNEGLEKKLSTLKKDFKKLLKEKQNISTDLWKLQKDYKHLTHKFNENTEIITLYNWIIHIDSNSLEYVAGYGYHSESLWDTSFIKEKIAMSTYLLIITENETIYCLPYCESAK